MAVSEHEHIPVSGPFDLAQIFEAQMNFMNRYSPEARLFTLEERVKLLEEKVQKLMEEQDGNR